MKTKLLRKIRKQYSIVYYPNGYKAYDKLWYVNKYKIFYKGSYFNLGIYETKQDALNAILKHLRVKYSKYSVNSKNNYTGRIVWP